MTSHTSRAGLSPYRTVRTSRDRSSGTKQNDSLSHGRLSARDRPSSCSGVSSSRSSGVPWDWHWGSPRDAHWTLANSDLRNTYSTCQPQKKASCTGMPQQLPASATVDELLTNSTAQHSTAEWRPHCRDVFFRSATRRMRKLEYDAVASGLRCLRSQTGIGGVLHQIIRDRRRLVKGATVARRSGDLDSPTRSAFPTPLLTLLYCICGTGLGIWCLWDWAQLRAMAVSFRGCPGEDAAAVHNPTMA